ncbi:MAG: DUF4287 domain-containing protein [Candidatus Nanopelagicaceae bacterium]
MPQSADRESYFPKIEQKHGQPMKYWFEVMREISDWKYPEQVAYLKEEHGFSQAHANALVMYSRGSKSSKRFATLSEYLKNEPALKQKTTKAIIKAIKAKHPKVEVVIAWNHPMIKFQEQYIFGISLAENHILLAPFDPKILSQFKKELSGYKVLKKTFQVPVDWKVDEKLLQNMIKTAILQIN